MHKHAELMRLYAEDAAMSDQPWLMWERRTIGAQRWNPMMSHPHWYEYQEYRRKIITTSKLISHPKPLDVLPENGAHVFTIGLTVPFCAPRSISICFERLSDGHKLLFRRGLLHASADAAIAHAKALIGDDDGEK